MNIKIKNLARRTLTQLARADERAPQYAPTTNQMVVGDGGDMARALALLAALSGQAMGAPGPGGIGGGGDNLISPAVIRPLRRAGVADVHYRQDVTVVIPAVAPAPGPFATALNLGGVSQSNTAGSAVRLLSLGISLDGDGVPTVAEQAAAIEQAFASFRMSVLQGSVPHIIDVGGQYLRISTQRTGYQVDILPLPGAYADTQYILSSGFVWPITGGIYTATYALTSVFRAA